MLVLPIIYTHNKMGKTLSDKEKIYLLECLKNGKTSLECSGLFNVSTATINNYRIRFKKEGYKFPNNRGRKKKSKGLDENLNHIKYEYIIDGIRVKLSEKPKSVQISKKNFCVDF